MEQIASDTMKEIPVPVAIDDKQKQDEAQLKKPDNIMFEREEASAEQALPT